MNINLLATDQGPDYYTFSGEVVTAHYAGVSKSYDLSSFPEGGTLTGASPVNGVPAIRNVAREGGELRVTLCQQVGPGHWKESGGMDVTQYDPDTLHVVQDTSKPFAGRPWAKTRQGKQYVEASHG